MANAAFYFQLEKYLKLSQGGKVIAEYVWIDGSNGIRSKSKVSLHSFFFGLYDRPKSCGHLCGEADLAR